MGGRLEGRRAPVHNLFDLFTVFQTMTIVLPFIIGR